MKSFINLFKLSLVVIKMKKEEKRLITVNNSINSIKNSINHFEDISSEEVQKLIWFANGPRKNYHAENEFNQKDNVNGFTINISLTGTEEPSAVHIECPIQKSIIMKDIPNPGYYPSYKRLSPEQRGIYLNWLNNIGIDVDIGYVFIFYYGLERHLFFGERDLAFDMILKLRTFYNKNYSFDTYSTNALITASLLENRPDWLEKYLKSSNSDFINNIYIFSKKVMNYDLTINEIINLSNHVGFKNKRYINNEPELFKYELKNLLLERFDKESMPLPDFSLENCSKKKDVVLANYSITNENRFIDVPDLIGYPEFKNDIFNLLKESHEKTKLSLRELRKRKYIQ